MKIDKNRLDALLRAAGFANYDEAAASASLQGIDISRRTLFNMARGSSWRSETLSELCRLLHCTPADLISDWNGDTHTHGTPQSVEEPQIA